VTAAVVCVVLPGRLLRRLADEQTLARVVFGGSTLRAVERAADLSTSARLLAERPGSRG